MLIQIFANTAIYRTPEPGSTLEREYYQITVKEGGDCFVVKEQHGWFDEEAKQPRHNSTTTLEDRDYKSLAEAIARHNAQVKARVEQGFKYECSLDFEQLVPRFVWRDLTGA